jgi:two-component system C4-dicarboxylate transport response regulator DctD
MTARSDLRVVFVEDDGPLREAMVQGLELEGVRVEAFDAARPALRGLSRDFDGVVVSDIRMPGMDGLEFFAALQAMDDELPVIFTTGHGDVAMAVDAMKGGAADFLTKPYSSAALVESIRRASEKRALVIENRKLREALRSRVVPSMLGSSDAVERLKRLIAEVGNAEIDLLVTGDSGTGKSFVARQIHDLGPRSERPFVTIDAGSWAHQDAELIVFGREPGSGLSRAGLIERASGGTLFLDDIDTMPEQFQARMLGVVERRTYLPLGASQPRSANLRIISAARDLSPANGSRSGIAQSLINRLNSVTIALPAIAGRRGDIPEIFRHFVAAFEREFETTARPLGDVEWHHLVSHDWPGNLHELRAYARAWVLGLPTARRASEPAAPESQTLKDRVASFERAVIEDTLRQCRGGIPDACRVLGLPRKTLYDKLARYGLEPRRFRAG